MQELLELLCYLKDQLHFPLPKDQLKEKLKEPGLLSFLPPKAKFLLKISYEKNRKNVNFFVINFFVLGKRKSVIEYTFCMEKQIIKEKLNKKFKNRFRQDLSFKDVTTFHIGGRIEYFVGVKNVKELKYIKKLSKKFNIPLFVLGGGSNVLAKDCGFSGIVVSSSLMNKTKFLKNKVKAFCGTRLGKLVVDSKKKGLSGLEWAIGIPGTVGGGIVMNAGAFNGQISDFVKKVTFFDGKRVRTMKTKKLNFSYRNSIFKSMKNWIVLSAVFVLKKKREEEIEKKLEFCVKNRQKTQNVGYFSAGSIFKRLPHITAAELIDRAGLKGKTCGGAMVSPVHAGYIVNFSNATFKDVAKLVDFILKSVYNIFGEKLELEVVIIGDDEKS